MKGGGSAEASRTREKPAVQQFSDVSAWALSGADLHTVGAAWPGACVCMAAVTPGRVSAKKTARSFITSLKQTATLVKVMMPLVSLFAKEGGDIV